MKTENTYSEEVFYQFKQIDKSSYREKISFFKKHSEKIKQLEIDRNIGVRIEACEAFFELGQFYYVLEMVDPLLEDIIMENIYEHESKDAFQIMLFKKAASLYNLNKGEAAKKVLVELLRLNPDDEVGTYLTKRILKEERRPKDLKVYAWSIAILILATIFFIFKSLIIDPFFEAQVGMASITSYGLGIAAISLVGIYEALKIYSIKKEFNNSIFGTR